MNICLLTMEWPPYGYGIGTYMFNLARGLKSFGHKVTVITIDKEVLACDGVKIIQVPLPNNKRTLLSKFKRWQVEPYNTWSLRAYKRFLEICDKEQFDIIETAEFGAWARHFVGNTDIPLVVRCHTPSRAGWTMKQNTNSSMTMPLWLRFQDRCERWQTFNADAIVSPSYALANQLSLSWVIPRSRFTVLPNPIDAELFCPAKANGKHNNDILYVGRLEHNKGVFELAESMNPLLRKYPDLKLHLIGTDTKSPKEIKNQYSMASDVIRSLISSKYHNRVIFSNHISVVNIVSYQQKALCSVMPTRSFESFSYTVLEAMSCGRPIVATHCGGPTEIITNRVDGLLVPPGNTQALTKALEELIKNPKFREQLALTARQTVKDRFAIPVVVPEIIQLYENVINNYQKNKSSREAFGLHHRLNFLQSSAC